MKMKSISDILLYLALSACLMLLTACVKDLALSTVVAGNSTPTALGLNSTVVPQPAPVSTVELDVFSGLPNPVWSLSESEVASLAELCSRLELTQNHGKMNDGLGYRGFIVHLVAPQSHVASTIHVFAGTVKIGTGAETIFYLDPHGQVERWLLDSAKPNISDELYTELSNEIQ